MQVFWGPDGFPANGAKVTNETLAELSPQGIPIRYNSRYNVVAVIDGTGQDDLTTKENLWRDRLSVPKQNFILKTDGNKDSSASIISTQTYSGTRVTNIRFGEAEGGEFVNRRTISFTVEAVYMIAATANAILSWKETVVIIGTGGPRNVWRYPVNGPGILQEVNKYTPVIATQTGEAVGHTKYPKPAKPLWPKKYRHEEADVITQDSPDALGRFDGAHFLNYAVKWAYRFERGDGPLTALPTLPKGVIT